MKDMEIAISKLTNTIKVCKFCLSNVLKRVMEH
jgi:hypothetical protein